MPKSELKDMVAKAKSERDTLLMLAMDARRLAAKGAHSSYWYMLAHTYDRSLSRIDNSIRLAEMSMETQKQNCDKHPNRFLPCIDCFKEQKK